MNIREITNDDTEQCARIIHQAFASIADRHNFPYDFPTPESAAQLAEMSINSPDIYGVAAEVDGRFAGSNFLWEFDAVKGVGPITVDPNLQAKGIGRRLMEAVINRGNGAAGIRLVQDAFNSASMSLYAGLGFNVVEPLVLVIGQPAADTREDTVVRRFEDSDLEAGAELCRRVHGYDRRNELANLSEHFPTCVVEREGEIVGYMAAPNFWQMNHSVAETNEDITDLIAGAAAITGKPVSFLLPTRQAELFRWCLANGMRVIKPMTLMAMGDYREPKGAFIPSVLY